MSQFLELLIGGLSLGCIYALIAMGFVVVFKATKVVNFAHASVLMLGAYLVARWHGSLGFFGAVALAAVICALVAALCDVLLVRPLRHNRGGVDALAILTIGINIVLGTELTRRVGTDLLPTGAPWGSDVTHVLGVAVPQTRIVAASVAIVLMAGLWAAFTYSDWGVAMRSTAADPETAALMGIRLSRVAAGAWALGGVLAAIGGAFFTSFPAAGVNNATGLLALTAIPAAVLGGLDSAAGAVVGGLTIGVATTFAAGYQDEIAFLGRGLSEVIPYIVLFAVLLWRPSGLFGTREITRV
ncbi:branched-chain amino acid ABC transporter permease [Candidatus Solirubrobacter pratensis]|uniref:branched-chain amino acid ABC transporter permease n=1 Tax=Candidatus Solirubrobacter pratensis TaxID=1298857 RepID=UPI0003F8ED00|nr:branched-chain amino acid ABC transporter permease [Candidatus Solirubrobacter pratensis]